MGDKGAMNEGEREETGEVMWERGEKGGTEEGGGEGGGRVTVKGGEKGGVRGAKVTKRVKFFF